MRAALRLGKELKRVEKNKGGTSEKKTYRLHSDTGRTPTLKDLGITKSQSSRWQLPQPHAQIPVRVRARNSIRA